MGAISNPILIVTLRFCLKNQKDSIATSNISLLECGKLSPSESNDGNEIIVNTYHQLKDIIALYETNTMTKYNMVKEIKGFSEDGEEIILFY